VADGSIRLGKQKINREVRSNVTSYLYDQLGRSVKEADPLGNSTAYAYDAWNKVV